MHTRIIPERLTIGDYHYFGPKGSGIICVHGGSGDGLTAWGDVICLRSWNVTQSGRVSREEVKGKVPEHELPRIRAHALGQVLRGFDRAVKSFFAGVGNFERARTSES